MYDLVKLYNKNGTLACVKRENVKDWVAAGKLNGHLWSETKPGETPELKAFEKRAEDFATKED